jgi:VWFA-related protein
MLFFCRRSALVSPSVAAAFVAKRAKRLCGQIVFVLFVAGVPPSTFSQQQPPRFAERVDVTRILIDARVVDDGGRPVNDLGVEDFGVELGGKAARVDSVQWVAGVTDDAPTLDAPAVARTTFQVSSGRLIVFVFQKSFERGRMPGLMRMLIESRAFIDSLTPRDRVAVLSFDSRLRIWLDFTNDRTRVAHALERGILLETPPASQASAEPSLVARLDPADVRRAHSIERALRLIGEALEDLPGAKSVVLVGHGFGRLGLGGVSMENEYSATRVALQAARASVFCLDVTDADYHSLEAGLQLVAEDTGGFFVRTHIFPRHAIDRLTGALAGHYVLFVENPGLPSGSHRIEVRLTRRNGHVLAKSEYVR